MAVRGVITTTIESFLPSKLSKANGKQAWQWFDKSSGKDGKYISSFQKACHYILSTVVPSISCIPILLLLFSLLFVLHLYSAIGDVEIFLWLNNLIWLVCNISAESTTNECACSQTLCLFPRGSGLSN